MAAKRRSRRSRHTLVLCAKRYRRRSRRTHISSPCARRRRADDGHYDSRRISEIFAGRDEMDDFTPRHHLPINGVYDARAERCLLKATIITSLRMAMLIKVMAGAIPDAAFHFCAHAANVFARTAARPRYKENERLTCIGSRRVMTRLIMRRGR